MMKKLILSILIPLSALSANAQTTTYPVQVNVTLIPPYSLYLDDYAAGTRERVSVTLVNRDMRYPSMAVRLRLTVKGNGFTLRTNSYATTAPVIIEPNVPYRLSREELSPYFSPQNLMASGTGSLAWQKNNKLPEGMLEFCFEAVEHHTGRRLSQPGCGMGWVVPQKPPMLSLPFNAETVAYRDPLNLLFQWTPRHGGLSDVEYEIIIKRLWDNGLKPEAAWPYSAEIYRETVRPTSTLYGVAMPPLTPGVRYAWAVRAVAKEGIDEIHVFENDGLSEVRWFELSDYCPPPLGVSAKVDYGAIKIEWTPLPEHLGYTVGYRRKDVENAGWFYAKTAEPRVILYDVQPGYTYEYRVGSACRPDNPVYGDLYTISIPVSDNSYDPRCGILPEADLSNKELLPELSPGEVFMAGDFPVYVQTVSGSNGGFSGEGYTMLPTLFMRAKLAVRWNSVTVNTDRKLIRGWVDAVYDESKGQIVNMDEFDGNLIKDGVTFADVDLNFTIPDNASFVFNPDDNTITVTDSEGNVVGSFVLPEDIEGRNTGGSIFPIIVKDEDGNLYKLEQTEEDDLTATLLDEAIVNINESPHNFDYYFSLNNDSIAINNHKLNIAKNNKEFEIKLLKKDGSINIDSVYLIVNSDTLKNTNVFKRKMINNLSIQAKHIGKQDTPAYLNIIVHNPPYVEFKTPIGYNGEFGFDDGLDFVSSDASKKNGIYDVIQKSTGDTLYCPFITMKKNQEIKIIAEIKDRLPAYNYYVESSTPGITCTHDTTTYILTIKNNSYLNDFSNPAQVLFYRKDKNGFESKELIGKCSIVSKDPIDTINVQIFYYKTDTLLVTNTVSPSNLETKMNLNSLNQSFRTVSVNSSIYTITDTTITAAQKTNSRQAYQRVIIELMRHKANNPTLHKDNTFYVIMTDLTFAGTNPGTYLAGGVLSNSRYAVMWEVPGHSPTDMLELIIHECGHSLQLPDTFNDVELGNPTQGFSRSNYMDYFIIRNMFFKSQIKKMHNKTLTQ